MNVEKLVIEYRSRTALASRLNKGLAEIKEMLSDAIDAEGIPDEKGHLWLTAGKFVLQRQRRQGDPFLNMERATQWARDKGIWDEVKVVREDLNPDALAGWVYDRRKDPSVEKAYGELFDTPEATWAFMSPKEQDQFEY